MWRLFEGVNSSKGSAMANRWTSVLRIDFCCIWRQTPLTVALPMLISGCGSCGRQSLNDPSLFAKNRGGCLPQSNNDRCWQEPRLLRKSYGRISRVQMTQRKRFAITAGLSSPCDIINARGGGISPDTWRISILRELRLHMRHPAFSGRSQVGAWKSETPRRRKKVFWISTTTVISRDEALHTAGGRTASTFNFHFPAHVRSQRWRPGD